MKRIGFIFLLAAFVLGISGMAAAAEPTLDKIKNSGVFTIGVRNASPPFAFINKQNERVGFSIDLAKLVHKNVKRSSEKPLNWR